MKINFKTINITLLFSWLMLFAVLPYALVLVLSFLADEQSSSVLLFHFTIEHYEQLFQTLYLKMIWNSFYLAGLCTLICLLVGYPFAYLLTRVHTRYKKILLLLMIIPFWSSSLVRSYAVMTLLKAKGVLNYGLLSLGIIDHPLPLLFTNTAVIIALVYNLLPFMILPLYSSIERLDDRLLEAARDLGANHWQVLCQIVFPLTMSGIVAGCILVFLPAMTLFYIPDLLGGAHSMLLGNFIETQFLVTLNWHAGSALSIVLTLLMIPLLWLYNHFSHTNKLDSLL